MEPDTEESNWTPSFGYTTIEILEKFKGLEVDDVVGAYLSAFRPSSVRIIPYPGEMKTDANLWRIDVYLDRNNKITKILQEVQVMLPDGCANGYQLKYMLDDKLEKKWLKFFA